MDTSTLRIWDANLNRAREALRVMEDYCRFVLDDASLVESAKALRHDLARAAGQSPFDQAIRARDTAGDVGCEIATPSEYERAAISDIALAAGKRLSEALRVLEEAAKCADRELAASIERMRYRGYELERRTAGTFTAHTRFAGVRLYVLLTESLCRGPWFKTAEAAIDGGANCLQLREKTLSDRELLARARRLADLCRERGTMLVVNDRPDVAALAGSDGVHLGQDDLAVRDARRVAGVDRLIGVSTHNVEQARSALLDAPDYVAVGPMYDSPTKPQPHIAGPATLAQVRKLTGLPLAAIGGITPDRVAELLAAGASCVCVCQAIISQPDVRGAAERFRAAIE